MDALLRQGDARLLLNAEVGEVREDADEVELRYRVAGAEERRRCSAAVIAVTADVVGSLLPANDLRCRRLLDATRYASYIVVAVAGIETAHMKEFRCIVAANGSLVVVQQRTADRRFAVLLCYHCGPRLHELAASTGEALVALTWRELSAFGPREGEFGLPRRNRSQALGRGRHHTFAGVYCLRRRAMGAGKRPHFPGR